METNNKFKNFDENFSLKNKNAIVTGAADGIGYEIARMYARKGANLIAFDLNESKALEEYAAEQGVQYLFCKGDLSKLETIQNAVSQSVDVFGKIDILVNCAGVGILETAEESSKKIWDLTMSINLTGNVDMALAVGRSMMQSGGGSIINIASQAGVVALDAHLSYGVAKAGLIQATKQLALEWGQYNIRVNAISPTVILTRMGEMNWNNEKGEAFKKSIPSRRFGYPEEVAACAVYLGSDAASLFNGANLIIDGGYTIA